MYKICWEVTDLSYTSTLTWPGQKVTISFILALMRETLFSLDSQYELPCGLLVHYLEYIPAVKGFCITHTRFLTWSQIWLQNIISFTTFSWTITDLPSSLEGFSHHSNKIPIINFSFFFTQPFKNLFCCFNTIINYISTHTHKKSHTNPSSRHL